MRNPLKNIGPGPLVAAAFIGPGTVTVCTLAGVGFGYELLWAMILSIVATIILQEMAARLGVVTQKDLSNIIRESIPKPFVKHLVLGLILSAIVIGNATYEAGNISGGVLGLESLVGQHSLMIFQYKVNFLSLLVGLIAFLILYIGSYKTIERSLIVLVVLMSAAFVITAIMTRPDYSEVLKGMLSPKLPQDSMLMIIGLIGTTVVPYNLFLHASLVSEKWNNASDIKYARRDTYISVIFGGMVSLCIIISAASLENSEISSAADLAKSLEPLFGRFSNYFLSLGLFAAGITSAITAPLAAAYVASGCFGWKQDLKSTRFRTVWIFIILVGIIFSSTGINSILIIQFAQFANGLLLPIIAGVLLWIMNKSIVLGKYKNTPFQNLVAISIIIITIILGARSILKVFNVL